VKRETGNGRKNWSQRFAWFFVRWTRVGDVRQKHPALPIWRRRQHLLLNHKSSSKNSLLNSIWSVFLTTHSAPLALIPCFSTFQEFSDVGKLAEEGDVAQQKLEVLLKEDKDRHNQALLGRLEHSVATQFNKCLQVY
jgi:hypothetical protein